jgi:FtsX-like permease family
VALFGVSPSLSSQGRDGQTHTADVRLYGTYSFRGLESSPQASSIDLLDLVTSRQLLGAMDTEHLAEIAALRQAAGATDIAREDAERELFGTPRTETPAPVLAALPRSAPERGRDGPYDPSLLERGAVLHVAVVLKDPAQLDQTLQDLRAASERAKLPLNVIPWQQAAGVVGEFIGLMQGVLVAGVALILLVGLVVINNALVMAMLERVQELGALRTIGAQRRFILWMVVGEALAVGLIFGALGTLVGALVLRGASVFGLPSVNDVTLFLFSGPRLFPVFSPGYGLFGIAAVTVVSVVSSLYPALLATRVSPRVAMAEG